MELCFATGNKNKLIEINKLLEPHGFNVKGLHDIGCFEDIPETADTLEGNALLKAQYVWDKYRIPCFADDTGLEVYSLNNEPGVYSARYAGPQKNNLDNIDLLLRNLSGKNDRKARFRTVISLILGEHEQHQFDGVVEGEIVEVLKGDHGFGYDPIFKPANYEITFAEMSLDEKNKISHRGKATQLLLQFLSGK